MPDGSESILVMCRTFYTTPAKSLFFASSGITSGYCCLKPNLRWRPFRLHCEVLLLPGFMKVFLLFESDALAVITQRVMPQNALLPLGKTIVFSTQLCRFPLLDVLFLGPID